MSASITPEARRFKPLREVALELHVHVQTAKTWTLSRPDFPDLIVIGGRNFVDNDAYETWLAAQRIPKGPRKDPRAGRADHLVKHRKPAAGEREAGAR